MVIRDVTTPNELLVDSRNLQAYRPGMHSLLGGLESAAQR